MSRTRHHSRPFREYRINGEINPKFGLHNWLQNEPKEWRRIYKHEKRRAELDVALRKAMEDPEGDVVFPLDKKPHIYYW